MLDAAGVQLTLTTLRDEQGRLRDEVRRAEVLIAAGEPIVADAFAGLEKARFLLRPYVGYDDIEVEAASEAGILVANVPDTFIEEVANHTFSTDGLITNIDLSGDIDQFSTWISALTSGGLIESGVFVGLVNSIVEMIYNAFGKIEEFFTDWMGIDWGGVEDTLDYWFPAV